MSTHPVERVEVLHLFPDERAALLEFLRDLSAEQWALPTVCPGWSVGDIARRGALVAQCWSVLTRVVLEIDEQVGMIRAVVLSGGGGVVASGGTDGTVRLWQAAARPPVATLRGHTSTVHISSQPREAINRSLLPPTIAGPSIFTFRSS